MSSESIAPEEIRFMREAIEEARLGIRSGHGGPFGSVIVRDGEIVGRGHNRVLIGNDSTAARMAVISPWAVESLSMSTRVCPRPTISPSRTLTLPKGPP